MRPDPALGLDERQSLMQKVNRVLAEAIILRRWLAVIMVWDLVFCTMFYSFRHTFQ